MLPHTTGAYVGEDRRGDQPLLQSYTTSQFIRSHSTGSRRIYRAPWRTSDLPEASPRCSPPLQPSKLALASTSTSTSIRMMLHQSNYLFTSTSPAQKRCKLFNEFSNLSLRVLRFFEEKTLETIHEQSMLTERSSICEASNR